MSYENVSAWLIEASESQLTQEMCNEAVKIKPYSLHCIPHCLRRKICV